MSSAYMLMPCAISQVVCHPQANADVRGYRTIHVALGLHETRWAVTAQHIPLNPNTFFDRCPLQL